MTNRKALPHIPGLVDELIPYAHIAIYARVSSDDSGREESVMLQCTNCQEYIARTRELIDSGLPIVEYSDNDKSGEDEFTWRPEWERLKAGVAAGTVRFIVTRDQSRLTRREWEAFFMLCQHYKVVGIHQYRGSVIRPDDLDSFTTSGITGTLNRRYVMEVKKLVNEKLADRLRRGLPKTGRAPYGYVWARNADGDKTFIIDEPAAKLIREIVRRVLAGEPPADIARDFTRRGKPTPNGGQAWDGKWMRDMLLNPALRGYQVVRHEIVGLGTWDPIIGEDQAKQLDEILNRPAYGGFGGKVNLSRKRGKPYRYLLSGIARCGKCNTGRLVGGGVRPRGGRCYICECGRDLKGCRLTLGYAQEVEQFVIDELLAALADPVLVAQLSQDDHAAARAAVRDDISAIEARRVKLATQKARDELDEPDWLVMRRVIAEDLGEAEARLAAIPAAPDDDLATVPKRWDRMSMDAKRATLRRAVEVTVLAGSESHIWAGPQLDRVKLRWLGDRRLSAAPTTT